MPRRNSTQNTWYPVNGSERSKSKMTDQYAVFGNPVTHSRSPQIHADFAAATGEDISYQKQLVAVDDFEAAADRFFAGGQGLEYYGSL